MGFHRLPDDAEHDRSVNGDNLRRGVEQREHPIDRAIRQSGLKTLGTEDKQLGLSSVRPSVERKCALVAHFTQKRDCALRRASVASKKCCHRRAMSKVQS